jgi:hypothetical protein
MWARIGQALAPGGVFAGQLFGIRDSWADDPDMTFHTRRQVEVLLDGLDILRLTRPKGTGTPSAAPSTGTPSTSSPASQSASTRQPARRSRRMGLPQDRPIDLQRRPVAQSPRLARNPVEAAWSYRSGATVAPDMQSAA